MMDDFKLKFKANGTTYEVIHVASRRLGEKNAEPCVVFRNDCSQCFHATHQEFMDWFDKVGAVKVE